MQTHSMFLAFLAFSFGAISAPVPSLDSRQQFTPQLVFHGARYEDSFGISTPPDGSLVTISELLFC